MRTRTLTTQLCAVIEEFLGVNPDRERFALEKFEKTPTITVSDALHDPEAAQNPIRVTLIISVPLVQKMLEKLFPQSKGMAPDDFRLLQFARQLFKLTTLSGDEIPDNPEHEEALIQNLSESESDGPETLNATFGTGFPVPQSGKRQINHSYVRCLAEPVLLSWESHPA